MKRFLFLNKLTIVCVYLVILAGGVVRSTGSGMGCPDWPKCFGSWLPPTSEKQLPTDYVQRYSNGGHLTVVFNVYKTWTEYVNRLLGALAGVIVFLMAVFAFSFYKNQPGVFYLSVFSVSLMGLQGWIGAKVVSTNLATYMVSIHMTIALVIVFILLLARVFAFKSVISLPHDQEIGRYLVVSIIVTSVQILLGTQVREEVDEIASQFGESYRSEWVSHLTGVFSAHKFMSILVIFANLQLIRSLYKTDLREFGLLLGIVVVCEIFSGLALSYYNIPALVQPLHLFMASIVIGIQLFLVSLWIKNRKIHRLL